MAQSTWTLADIGSPATAATMANSGVASTMTAAGKDIGGSSDQFSFAYQVVDGDVEIRARVDSLIAANRGAQAGVMIRAALGAGDAHGSALVFAGAGTGFERRPQAGAYTSTIAGPNAAAPVWVRLVRSGTTVTSYSSNDGASWIQIARGTVSLGASAYVGLAVSSHNRRATATAAFSQVSVTRSGLAPGQQATDIGGPALQGFTSFAGGTYQIHAGGADIGGVDDQFHYVYQSVNGDADVTVRVASQTNSNGLAKAGLMFRETLGANASNVSLLVTPSSGYLFQRRAFTGTSTDSSSGGAGAAPGWVRLKRNGSLFTAYRSSDGQNWTVIGSDSISMADTVYVGIAVTSHNAAVATDAVVDGFGISVSANQPPAVAIASPASGATFTAPASITIAANASDPENQLTNVEFYNGSTLIGNATTAPYSFTWPSVPAGTYSLTARAYDGGGASTTSAAVNVMVNAAVNQPPTASITSPANNAAFTAPAGITIVANATDPENQLARVEFYNGATLLGSDTTAPYSFTWGSVAAGTYALKAVAVDGGGATGTSATANVVVSNPPGGLVAAYGFEEGTGTVVTDSSGAGRNGTLTSASWVQGRYGQALALDGTSSVVTIGDLDLTGSFTVMGWTKTQSLYSGTCGSFVMKALDYGFEICNATLLARIGSGSGWSTYVTQPLSTADLNVWKHLAMTYDGTTVRLYIDGVLINSATGAHVSNNNPLLVGRWTPASEYWNGVVDEVRVYSRMLSQAEVQVDMNAPVAGGTANQPPSASIAAPAAGATFTAPASIAIAANAGDPENQLTKVEFYSGATLLGTDTTAPYAFTWSSVPAGTYSLTARAYDAGGAVTTSAAVSVTVSSTSTSPQGVMFRASTDHATLTNYRLEVFAAGADVNTATPIASTNAGKPAPDANNDITVTLPAFFQALPPGDYQLIVAAVNGALFTRSAPLAFTR